MHHFVRERNCLKEVGLLGEGGVVPLGWGSGSTGVGQLGEGGVVPLGGEGGMVPLGGSVR